MAEGEIKEPPPKPTRIRTATSSSGGNGPTTPGGSNSRHSANNSPVAKAPVPLPRATHKHALNATSAPAMERRERSSGSTADSQAQMAPASWKDLLREPGTRPKPVDVGMNVVQHQQSSSGGSAAIATTIAATGLSPSPRPAPVVPPRLTTGPTPPPKPKRISLAPQPKAKPVSLQSAPLQLRDPSAQTVGPAAPTSSASVASIAPAASVSSGHFSSFNAATTTSLSRSAELPQTTTLFHSEIAAANASPPISPIRPSFVTKSANSSMRSHSAQPGHERRVDSVFTGSTPPPTSATTLFGTRSRLRSTSDTKTSPFVATAVPQSSRAYSAGLAGLSKGPSQSLPYQSGSPTYGSSSQSPTSDSEDYSDENQASTTLTASLHKIQALAHEQTGRMKQINYSEKKADIAEAVYEKSSVWRARGAEWGGIAKKAWEERGGMGGIAGGLADRWKRKDGVTEPGGWGQDVTRSESSEPIFGLPLQEAVRISRIAPSVGVPAVVTRCIEYLDIMGVEEVGLYRVPGSTSNVARLRTMFDQGLDYDFLQKGHEPQNPHDVATLLKMYLRELPAQIIPADLMANFNSIDFTAPQQHLTNLRDSLGLIPLENYILLGTLCRHLSNLADYELCTKMNISNLGLIFCPTLQIGSVLFKNLLGGDGGDEERARCLKVVWSDFEKKQEELENLEMIKEFEMGLLVVEEANQTSTPRGSGNGHTTTANNTASATSPNGDINNSNVNINSNGNGYANGTTGRFTRSHEWSRNVDRERGQDDWEDVGQDELAQYGRSPPRSSNSPVQGLNQPPFMKHPGKNNNSGSNNGSPLWASGHQREPGKMSVQPVPDLYDELMSRELTEATNTPLIDFSDSDTMHVGGDACESQWRRHAREPAINKRSDVHTGHSRMPAGHTRIPAGL
ncbi:hypothetical protein BG004_003329 [Podila humilis]|nr:hypothetical protein BG004_003329 [Podila humilis]